MLEQFGGSVDEDPGRATTFKGLKGCRYLQQVINETARLGGKEKAWVGIYNGRFAFYSCVFLSYLFRVYK